ncbi:MAG: hypothetical protein GKR90_11470 [Pseudomonadales bacterium]|nr:hypothetical protein [Pseudomonadales bacterium]
MRTILVLVLLVSACSPATTERDVSDVDGADMSERVEADFSNGSTALGEAFIDAFYSWDAPQLRQTVATASHEDIERVLYYQGWAIGANYAIQTRRSCERDQNTLTCAITVTDDFGRAMGYTATDTFTLVLEDEAITNVAFEGDDPPIFSELQAWIGEEQPEIYTGPCKDLFAGGTTPGDCARAVATAAQAFMNLRK